MKTDENKSKQMTALETKQKSATLDIKKNNKCLCKKSLICQSNNLPSTNRLKPYYDYY